MPSRRGDLKVVSKAAVTVRAMHPGPVQHGAMRPSVQASALLDTGADVCMVPQWALDELGMKVDEGSRRTMHSAAGKLEACSARVYLQFYMGRYWNDIGVIDAVVPDTEGSHDPRIRQPFLLGLDGFFDRFSMCMDHSKEVFQLGKIGGW